MPQGKVRTIAGQKIYDCSEHFHLKIRKPWYSAYKQFGWEEGIAGIGIAEETLKEAIKLKRKIKLTYYKNTNDKYLISPRLFIKIATLVGGEYIARNKTKLLVIPVTSLEKEPSTEEIPVTFDPKEALQARLRLKEKYREILSKLH